MFTSFPSPPVPDEVLAVAGALDPVLRPLAFDAGQAGASGDEAQVTFCRGLVDSVDGACVDLVVSLRKAPGWRITDVHYWGFERDRWHLDFDREAGLDEQLAGLARTLPAALAR